MSSARQWIQKSLATFHSLDNSGDGFLDAAELGAAFQKMGIAPPQDMHAFLARFDKNKDKKIDANEFMKLVGALLDPRDGEQVACEAMNRKWMELLKRSDVVAGDANGGSGGDITDPAE